MLNQGHSRAALVVLYFRRLLMNCRFHILHISVYGFFRETPSFRNSFFIPCPLFFFFSSAHIYLVVHLAVQVLLSLFLQLFSIFALKLRFRPSAKYETKKATQSVLFKIVEYPRSFLFQFPTRNQVLRTFKLNVVAFV